MSGKSYELVYFDARGRGEQIRLAFAASGITLKDTRIDMKDWPAAKPKAPQGRAPYLVITEGKKEPIKASQSAAILRFVGNDLNKDLYGEDALQKLFIDEIIDTCVDLSQEWEKVAFSQADEKTKAEAMKKFKGETVPKFYDMLENCIKAHGSDGFAVGKKLSLADCSLYNCVQNCDTECLDKYKCLKSNREKVAADPKLSKYLKERKETPI